MASVMGESQAERERRIDEFLSGLREQLIRSGYWYYEPPTLGTEAKLVLSWHTDDTLLAYCPNCWKMAVRGARIAGARCQCQSCERWYIVRQEWHEAISIVGGRQSIPGMWHLEPEQLKEG